MGGRWVPGVSLIGLACLIALPMPGLGGIAIGGSCLLVIAAWAAMLAIGFVLSLLAAPVVRMIRPSRTPRRRRRDVHAGSGIARRTARSDRDASAGEAREVAAPAARDAPAIAARRAPRRSREPRDRASVRTMRTAGA